MAFGLGIGNAQVYPDTSFVPPHDASLLSCWSSQLKNMKRYLPLAKQESIKPKKEIVEVDANGAKRFFWEIRGNNGDQFWSPMALMGSTKFDDKDIR